MKKYAKAAGILFAIWTAVGLTFSGVAYLAMVSEGRSESMTLVLTMSLIRSYVWGIFTPLIFVLAKRLPIDPRGIRWRNVVSNLLAGLIVSFLYSMIFVTFGGFSERGSGDVPATFTLTVQRFLVPALYTFFSLFTPTFFTIQALLFYRNYKEEAAKNAELQRELSSAQLNALKMQLQPHFLFNSLHSISSLILLDPKRANEMVALLGDFLRQTLEHSNDQLVPLSEELEFLRCYLRIEETRFEDRLKVEFDIGDDLLGAAVPHLIMQPIVENAVKHGIAPFEITGFIRISARHHGNKLVLSVTNSGQVANRSERLGVMTTNGMGIRNVRSRLEQVYGREATLQMNELETGGSKVDITIPFTRSVEPRKRSDK